MKSPQIVLYYRLYAGFMVLMNLFTLGLGIALVLDPNRYVNVHIQNPAVIEFMGWFFIIVGAVFIVLPGISLFFSNRPWAWNYNLAMLILGIFFSCMLLCPPAAIVCVPLLFAWFKPDVRAWYDAGRPGVPYGDYTGPDDAYDYDAAAAQNAEGDSQNDEDQSPPNPY